MSGAVEYWIPLPGGLRTRVDKDDFERFGGVPWRAFAAKAGNHYAVRDVWVNGVSYRLHLHREILGLVRGDGRLVDHRDRDGLNNTRENLRLANGSQNGANRVYPNGTTGFRGVRRMRDKYQAQISGGPGRRYHLGTWATATEAAWAYNEAALRIHGEFAILNDLPATAVR